jgi:hypothetical protein
MVYGTSGVFGKPHMDSEAGIHEERLSAVIPGLEVAGGVGEEGGEFRPGDGVFALKLNLAAPGAECMFDEVGSELSLAEAGDQFFEDSSELFIGDEGWVVVE